MIRLNIKDNNRKRVFITGATGVMGREALNQIVGKGDYDVTVLARPSKRNRRTLRPYDGRIDIVWGDLLNGHDVARGVADADIVLHIGGLVSPVADWQPEQCVRVNTGAMKNIIDAVKATRRDIKVVYIGSVAQYGNYARPDHWGGVGDAMQPSLYDAYGWSKVEAERLLANSGIKHWVSLRQTGILHHGLLMKATDPITFHVPPEGVLEWVSAYDSGRLMERVCRDDVPESFWRDFYNIGGGAEYRMTNHEFESWLLKAMGCPPPERIFEPGWFATSNFHGMWYTDSDRLEALVPFRSGISVDGYFAMMKKQLPWYFGMAPLAPAFLLKAFMKRVAHTGRLGTLWWLENGREGRIMAAWGNRAKQAEIRSWDDVDRSRPSDVNPGARDMPGLNLQAVRERVGYLKGRVLDAAGQTDSAFDPDKVMKFRCGEGHEFSLTPRAMLRGGHWCPGCLKLRAFAPE